MSRLMTVAALVALAACGSPVKKMCENLEGALESCATGEATGTGTATGESCETVYENCSDADLDILNGMADCIEADCEDFSCFDDFANLSGECLGIPGTGTGTGTE
jgi:hypothetical protein